MGGGRAAASIGRERKFYIEILQGRLNGTGVRPSYQENFAVPIPITTGPVHHQRLTVADVGRGRAFYTEVRGFRHLMDLPSGVFLFAGLVDGDSGGTSSEG